MAPALECAASTPVPRSPAVPIVPEVRAEAERLSSDRSRRGSRNAADGRPRDPARRPIGSEPPFAREYGDLDFAVRKRDGRAVSPFLAEQGYVPEKLFNSITARTPELRAPPRRRDHRRHRGRAPNVAPDRPARTAGARAADDRPGRPAAHEAAGVGDQRQGSRRHHVPAGRSAALGGCVRPRGDRPVAHPRSDRRRLGPCHTLERNLRTAAAFAHERRPINAPLDPVVQAEALLAAVAAGRKSLAWRVRGRIGERMRWYETPEEIQH